MFASHPTLELKPNHAKEWRAMLRAVQFSTDALLGREYAGRQIVHFNPTLPVYPNPEPQMLRVCEMDSRRGSHEVPRFCA
jgi:hypothetical protein